MKNINYCEIEFIEYIGKGAFSIVYKARYNNTIVAVKIFKTENKNHMNMFNYECSILHSIGHKNVVKLIGVGINNQSPFIVMEYIRNGTLKDFLENSRVNMILNEADVLGLALQIAEALHHVHYNTYNDYIVIHRDLKPENIGFSNGRVKILDFGLSRTFMKRKYGIIKTFEMSGNVGTRRYMAPEVGLYKKYNEKVDVYSFALIVWEVLTGNRPYEKHIKTLENSVFKMNQRPEIPNNISNKLRNILILSWHKNINIRPKFGDIISMIKSDSEIPLFNTKSFIEYESDESESDFEI